LLDSNIDPVSIMNIGTSISPENFMDDISFFVALDGAGQLDAAGEAVRENLCRGMQVPHQGVDGDCFLVPF